MAAGDDEQRIETGLFQRRAGEQGEIQAGGQAAVEDGARRADLLALALEAGRRHRVGQLQTAQRRPQGRTQLPDASPRAALVPVQRRGLAGAAQDLGGRAQQAIHRRVVGHDEGRGQFRHAVHAAPLVAGQQLDRIAPRLQDLFALAYREGQLGDQAFLQTAEQGGVEFEVAIIEIEGALGVQTLQVPGARDHEGRLGGHRQADVDQGFLAAVGEAQFAQHGHRVLVRRKTDLAGQHQFDIHAHRLPPLLIA